MYLQAWRLEPLAGRPGVVQRRAGSGRAAARDRAAVPRAASSSRPSRSTGSWGRRSPSWRASCCGPRSRGSCSTAGSRGDGSFPPGLLTAVGAGIYGVATSIYMPRLMESYSERYGLFGVTRRAGRVVAVHRADPRRGDGRGRRVRPRTGAVGPPPPRPARHRAARRGRPEARPSRRCRPRPPSGRSPRLPAQTRAARGGASPSEDDPAAPRAGV